MLKLDNSLLEELGLAALPEDQKQTMLQHIYETLELRVGTDLANQMTDQQLEEFEKFIDDGGDANQAQALQWLESNLPNYKEVVNRVFEELKNEVRGMSDQIMASSGLPVPGSSVATGYASAAGAPAGTVTPQTNGYGTLAPAPAVAGVQPVGAPADPYGIPGAQQPQPAFAVPQQPYQHVAQPPVQPAQQPAAPAVNSYQPQDPYAAQAYVPQQPPQASPAPYADPAAPMQPPAQLPSMPAQPPFPQQPPTAPPNGDAWFPPQQPPPGPGAV